MGLPIQIGLTDFNKNFNVSFKWEVYPDEFSSGYKFVRYRE